MKKILLALFLSFVFSAAQAGNWMILEPPAGFSPAYHHAATEFQYFYRAVTGVELPIVTEPVQGASLVVIGGDNVNGFVRSSIESGLISSFNLGADSDAYRMVSAGSGGCSYLFLAGGNGRATLYAVYDFFERQAGCRYFWDGDIIPRRDAIEMTGLDVLEVPRFAYRGIRYFAHRSLTRFQAEHWGPEEWEREIDWIVKKRLNLFMLRIGMDDVFQKAFPDIVSYPPVDGPMPGTLPRSYNDRTTAWPLKYRGELRKHILQYARERELIHPEDMGTMTHWYCPTPKDYMETVQPELFSQSNKNYTGANTLMVWDIRNDENLENYWHLTETHIREYGSPQMFHTIGLAERNFFKDRGQNMELKRYTYRRLISKLREHYPNAPLIVAGWDFYVPGWSGEEAETLLSELNPENTIVMDYMSDLKKGDFRKWVPRGRFPYMFGLFHAYEPENELRGNYGRIAERLSSAIDDPLCKGFVYWPENSHTDALALQHFTHNSWSPDMLTAEENIAVLCRDRYGEYAGVMEKAWNAVLPYIVNTEALTAYVWRRITSLPIMDVPDNTYKTYSKMLSDMEQPIAEAAGIWKTLAEVPYGKGNAFVDRDVIDLARTLGGRLLSAEIYRYLLAQRDFQDGKCSRSDVRKAGERGLKAMTYLRDILSLHDDYSLNATWKQTESVYSPLNPAFEQALKGNAENTYCRTYISELFDYYFLPEYRRYMENVNRKMAGKEMIGDSAMQDLVDAFYDKPLREMRSLSTCARTAEDYGKLLGKIALLY